MGGWGRGQEGFPTRSSSSGEKEAPTRTLPSPAPPQLPRSQVCVWGAGRMWGGRRESSLRPEEPPGPNWGRVGTWRPRLPPPFLKTSSNLRCWGLSPFGRSWGAAQRLSWTAGGEMGRDQRPGTDGTALLGEEEGDGKRLRLQPPGLTTSSSRVSQSSHRDGASRGERFRPGGGSLGLAGASRRRGALRCRGGWHRLAAMGWVPGPQREGATAGDRQRSALWARPLACWLQPRPQSPGGLLRSPLRDCRGRTTRAQG